MKLTTILTGIVSLASFVSAIGEESDPAAVLKFNVDYTIKEHPEIAPTDVVDLFNGDTITLDYTVSNDEDEQLAIVGVAGSFRDPATNEINTNITAASVGPIVLEPGMSHKFSQSINLNLYPNNYILSPVLFVSRGDAFVTATPRPQLASVSDTPISMFNPQLLFLEIVLLATFAGIGYLLYESFGKAYFKGTAPTKKPVKTPTASSPAPEGKSYDSSWIPEGHIKKTKKKN